MKPSRKNTSAKNIISLLFAFFRSLRSSGFIIITQCPPFADYPLTFGISTDFLKFFYISIDFLDYLDLSNCLYGLFAAKMLFSLIFSVFLCLQFLFNIYKCWLGTIRKLDFQSKRLLKKSYIFVAKRMAC